MTSDQMQKERLRPKRKIRNKTSSKILPNMNGPMRTCLSTKQLISGRMSWMEWRNLRLTWNVNIELIKQKLMPRGMLVSRKLLLKNSNS